MNETPPKKQEEEVRRFLASPVNESRKILPIVALVLALACLPASFRAFEFGHGFATLLSEDIDKRFMSEDSNYEVPASARVGAYLRAAPVFLLLVAPMFIGGAAPLVLCLLFLRRLLRPSRSYRAPGWLLFAFFVLSAAVFIFVGFAPASGRALSFAIAALLVFGAFYPSVPQRHNATPGNAS